MMKLEPQFLHSYLSPSAKPGVSQVVLQVGQLVNGRLELRLPGRECSACIACLYYVTTDELEIELLLRSRR